MPLSDLAKETCELAWADGAAAEKVNMTFSPFNRKLSLLLSYLRPPSLPPASAASVFLLYSNCKHSNYGLCET